ncbi:unnamed protein product [Closterium sp. NIES-53]
MAFEAFIAWLPVAERESGKKLKNFQSDGGGEYTSQRFKQFLAEKGIKRLISLPYAHQQQGVAERMNRTLQNTMRKLLRGMQLPNHQWPEAMDHAVMLHNLLSSSLLPNNASPHLLWTGKQSSTKMLRWGLHLGIEKNYNAWKIFDVHSKETVAARDVIFYERLTLPTYLANLEENRDPTCGFRGDRHFASAADEADWDEQNVDNASDEAGPLPYCSVPIPMDDENPRESINTETYFDLADTGYVTPAEVNTNEVERVGPNFIPDPEDGDEAAYPEDTTLPRYTQSGLQILGLVTAVHGTDTPKEPATVQQALGGEHKEKWREAMDKELKAQQERNTRKVVPIGVARNKTVLTGKWVFRVKTKADGTIDKFKARWVVRGFDQEHGRDFTKTFAPVSRHTSLRILLAVAAMKKKKLRQIDVANAFLYAPVDAEIYVELPHGSHGEPNQVCQLQKSLYGIKQAPRLWQQYLHARLIRIGFKQLPHDQGMYRFTKDDDYILLIVYVDDLLYIGSTDNVTTWFEGELQKELTLTVSSTVTQYLALNIEEGEDAIYLNAAKYADTIAKRFALTPTTISTPYRYTAGNNKTESAPLKPAGIRNYQRKLGCLLFAAVTCRPDLSYSASQLATYLKRPEDKHMKELDRALHYLGGLYIGKAVLKNNVFVLDFVPDLGTADSDAIVNFADWTHPPYLDPDFSPEGFWYSHTIPEAERTRALVTIQHSAGAEPTSAAAGTPTTLTPPVASSSTASPHINDIPPTPAQQLTPTPREVHRSANFIAGFYSNSDLYRRSPGHRADESTWHARMGHASNTVLNNTIRAGVLDKDSLLLLDGRELQRVRGTCLTCPEADLPHRSFAPHHNPSAPAYAPLEKVYSDILYNREPGQVTYNYTITFIDAATRYVWHLNLPSRDMALAAFAAWLPVAERESGVKLKSLQSDGGGEYTSQRFKMYLAEKGIKQLLSLPYAHQQQGVAERMNRTLQNSMRKLLRGMRLPNHQWPAAMDHAVMLHNLLSSSSLPNNASPHLLWTGKQGSTKMQGAGAGAVWHYVHGKAAPVAAALWLQDDHQGGSHFSPHSTVSHLPNPNQRHLSPTSCANVAREAAIQAHTFPPHFTVLHLPISHQRHLSPTSCANVAREAAILAHLSTGYVGIATLIDQYEDATCVHFILQLCTGGMLYDGIKAEGSYSEQQAAGMVRQIVQAVQYMHGRGVMHRDLKLENFLLLHPGDDAPLMAIDFGLSTFFEPGQRFKEVVGSAYYVAPEVLRRDYGSECDVWSIGVITYMLLCGTPPFWDGTLGSVAAARPLLSWSPSPDSSPPLPSFLTHLHFHSPTPVSEEGICEAVLKGEYEMSKEGICEVVLKGEYEMSSPPWPAISQQAKHLVGRMLDSDAARRITTQKILEHEWVREGGAPTCPLALPVMKRVLQFCQMNHLKRRALANINKKLLAPFLPFPPFPPPFPPLFLHLPLPRSPPPSPPLYPPPSPSPFPSTFPYPLSSTFPSLFPSTFPNPRPGGGGVLFGRE